MDCKYVRLTANIKVKYKLTYTKNKSAKLTQNTPGVFVVNSVVMTTFLGAGYSTWRADTTNSGFGQFKGHNSGEGEIGRL